MGLKGAAQRILATDRKVVPGALKRLVHDKSPLEYFFDEPIGQIFLADDTFDTFLCVNNFLTVLNPEVPTPVALVVELYDGAGKPIHRFEREIPNNGSLALSARELLAEAGANCPLGLATCSLRPLDASPEAEACYKQMGQISSHFFTYYLNTRTEAMAIIHPQSAVGQTRQETDAWRSGQSIVTEGLEGVSLYQANHGVRAATVRYQLCDAENDRPVADQALRVAASSANVAYFEMERIKDLPAVIYVRTDSLPTPNGKPLLMRRYGEGRFSMNHA